MAQPPNLTVVPHVPDSQKSLPRTSVGPVSIVPAPLAHLRTAIRAGMAQYTDEPLGLTNNGNHCYRNSILRLMISSQRFMSYVRRWHLNVEIGPQAQSPNRNILYLIEKIASAAERGITPGLPAHVQDQADVNTAVGNLWNVTCSTQNVPSNAGPQQVALGGGNVWNTAPVDDHGQQDASEWAFWLIDAIERQLATYVSTSPPNNAQVNFRHLLYLHQTDRWTCSNCRFKVRRRSGDPPQKCLIVNFPENTAQRTFDQLKSPLPLQNLISQAFFSQATGFTCPRCSDNTSAKDKYSTLRNTPEVLLVQIQRTAFHGNRASKIMQAVSIPEYLDITSYLDPHHFGVGSIAKYRLSSVVSHLGKEMTAGHYICSARVGERYDKWHEFNDDIVTPCSMKDFDDSDAESFTKRLAFNRRATPYFMLYEFDHKKSIQTPGRAAMNPGAGHTADTQPAQWYSNRVPRTQLPPVLDLPGDQDDHYPDAMTNEDPAPRAEMRVAVEIDDEVFEFPRTIIEHFDINRHRLIDIKASIVGDDGNGRKELDLAQAYADAVVDQSDRRRAGRRNPRLTKPKNWARRWKVSKR